MAVGNFFKRFRKNDTVIDLGDMQRRGLIRKRNAVEASKEEKVVDLTTTNAGPLGFLGSFASSASNVSSESPETDSFQSSVSSSSGRTKLKGILRDLKIDMKNTTDKVYKISDRLDLIEQKIDRLERRTGVGN